MKKENNRIKQTKKHISSQNHKIFVYVSKKFNINKFIINKLYKNFDNRNWVDKK